MLHAHLVPRLSPGWCLVTSRGAHLGPLVHCYTTPACISASGRESRGGLGSGEESIVRSSFEFTRQLASESCGEFSGSARLVMLVFVMLVGKYCPGLVVDVNLFVEIVALQDCKVQ